jgi:DNA-binding transcriptional MocR family regulator
MVFTQACCFAGDAKCLKRNGPQRFPGSVRSSRWACQLPPVWLPLAIGVPTDENGIIPDELDSACRQHAPRAVYLIPTIHNPTTATMPLSRRKEVAEILRRHEVLLFEDDAYGKLEPNAVPLASLVPERTYFAASLSKCIAPGLRVSLLLTPDQASAEVLVSRHMTANRAAQ